MSEKIHAQVTAWGGGFSRGTEIVDYVRSYVAEMAADGWSTEPTYNGEAIERATRLRRDGFIASSTARPSADGLKSSASIHVWGPDGLAIVPPFPYSFDACMAATETCSACRKTGVPTERVGFAGRVCATCLPAQRARIETPGWNS